MGKRSNIEEFLSDTNYQYYPIIDPLTKATVYKSKDDYYTTATQPLKWKIIGINTDGPNTITLMCQNMLYHKPYDAKEEGEDNRANNGSNAIDSNLHQWLNSDKEYDWRYNTDDDSWYSPQHEGDQNFSDYYNKFSNEGFLSHFSLGFRESLKAVPKTVNPSKTEDPNSINLKIFLPSIKELGLEEFLISEEEQQYYTPEQNGVTYFQGNISKINFSNFVSDNYNNTNKQDFIQNPDRSPKILFRDPNNSSDYKMFYLDIKYEKDEEYGDIYEKFELKSDGIPCDDTYNIYPCCVLDTSKNNIRFEKKGEYNDSYYEITFFPEEEEHNTIEFKDLDIIVDKVVERLENLPIASADSAGVVKIGNGLDIYSDGELNAKMPIQKITVTSTGTKNQYNVSTSKACSWDYENKPGFFLFKVSYQTTRGYYKLYTRYEYDFIVTEDRFWEYMEEGSIDPTDIFIQDRITLKLVHGMGSSWYDPEPIDCVATITDSESSTQDWNLEVFYYG